MTKSTEALPPHEIVEALLTEAGIALASIDERTFPGERWIIAHVAADRVLAAQSLAGPAEEALNQGLDDGATQFVVAFRPQAEPEQSAAPQDRATGLADKRVDNLIQLLEARSRTSDAVPSLNYVQDPRSSVAAIGAARHHLVYGRRGVGKTALLLEAKRLIEARGDLGIWLNAHVLRNLNPAAAFAVVAETMLSSIAKQGGTSHSQAFADLTAASQGLAKLRKQKKLTDSAIGARLPDLNEMLRSVLRPGLMRAYVFLDDFYLLPIDSQPAVLDYLSGALRDCDGWLKIASIERLTKPYEPSTQSGLEVPHDASKIDLDVTLEDPLAAQTFLESVLTNYTAAVGIGDARSITKPEARGRLVLASGGVPRDYLNLLASSIVVARESRELARQVGKEDVAVAAGRSSLNRKRDLEQDVSSASASGHLLAAFEWVSSEVKRQSYTYFRVNLAQHGEPGYQILGQLVDLRFAHLIQTALSDQHQAGTKYEVYVLALSEYTDIRLKRNLHVLDLHEGRWTGKLSGRAKTTVQLSGTQLRDRLRHAPVVDLGSLPE